MRRRARGFASPFVVTIAACGGGPGPGPVPVPAGSETPWADSLIIDPPVRELRGVRVREHGSLVWKVVGDLRFTDPGCARLEADGTESDVECPEELLPVAGADELVVAPWQGHPTTCYRVYERHLGERVSRTIFDEGLVRCPAGGPNVIMPDPDRLRIGNDRYWIDREELTCRKEVPANPPYSVVVDCPTALLPELTNGAEPTRRSGGLCFHGAIEVKCP